MNSKKIALVLFCLLLPIFLLLLSYKTVISFSDLTPAQEKVFLFLEGKQDLAVEFTEQEASHLEDVKRVMDYADEVFYALLLVITIIITYHKKNKDFLFQLLNYGGKSTVLSIILIGAFYVLSFDLTFALFHNIFFPQGNWLFAPDSVIIQAFPIEFFVAVSRNIFLLTLILGIIFILSRYLKGHVFHNRN
ncbi:DUF1461 domain-containing protein [Candidatus Woesearchaeota archaeon]|nr:DUF1461 domain-containing protein [Candidatus Woesearchaeota archaeon]